MTTKPTYTKYYSKTTTLIIKIKQAKKKYKLLKHNNKQPTQQCNLTTPQSTFILRPPHTNHQQPLPCDSFSRNSSLTSSSFTSNDSSSNSCYRMSDNQLHTNTTSYTQPSNYPSKSSHSSNRHKKKSRSSIGY